MTSPPSNVDKHTTVADLRAWVRSFVDERDWRQFHSPKNLSMSLAIEAAELMEHFQWISTEASRDLSGDAERKSEIAEELADVICYALALANEMDLDVSTALQSKMAKNRQKYPAAEFRGRFGHDDPPKDL